MTFDYESDALPERESAVRKNTGILTLFRKTHAISHAVLLKAQRVRATEMVALSVPLCVQ